MSLLSARAPKINFADESRRGLQRRANRVRFSPLVAPPVCPLLLHLVVYTGRLYMCMCVCVYLRE